MNGTQDVPSRKRIPVRHPAAKDPPRLGTSAIVKGKGSAAAFGTGCSAASGIDGSARAAAWRRRLSVLNRQAKRSIGNPSIRTKRGNKSELVSCWKLCLVSKRSLDKRSILKRAPPHIIIPMTSKTAYL